MSRVRQKPRIVPVGSPVQYKKYPLTLIFILPALCILFVGLYSINPRLVDTLVPLRENGFLPWSGSIIEFLPPHPKSFHETWQYAKLEEKLVQLENTKRNDTKSVNEILKDASKLAKRPVTVAQLHALEELLIEIDNETSIISKVWGFFSFVNLLWIIAFIGLLVTLIPCIYVCFAPLFNILVYIGWCLSSIFMSKIAFVIYEISSWVFVCIWTIAAHQYSSDFSYLLGLFACGWYYFFLYVWLLYHERWHTDRHYSNTVSTIDFRRTVIIVYTFLGLFAFPMTFLFQSTLIGWISVICLYSVLGFSVVGGGLCYFIGFNNKDALIRCVVSSFFLILFYSAYKIAGLPAHYLVPFASPLMILGNTVYFLGLLIASSQFSRGFRGKGIDAYISMQLITLLSIFTAYLVGSVYSIAPMVNVASVFLVLYIFEKIVELPVWYNGGGIWLLGFFLSISLFIICFYLHGHPDVIVSLFDSSWLIAPVSQ